jgi:NAD(P)-dependent dehydrogenase (short-subunit alcohol dehydrogenase family)
MRLKDKVCVITGGGSRIGRATALLFAQKARGSSSPTSATRRRSPPNARPRERRRWRLRPMWPSPPT